jgi:hypothetical protein
MIDNIWSMTRKIREMQQEIDRLEIEKRRIGGIKEVCRLV